jgi:hypothetical protein
MPSNSLLNLSLELAYTIFILTLEISGDLHLQKVEIVYVIESGKGSMSKSDEGENTNITTLTIY